MVTQFVLYLKDLVTLVAGTVSLTLAFTLSSMSPFSVPHQVVLGVEYFVTLRALFHLHVHYVLPELLLVSVHLRALWTIVGAISLCCELMCLVSEFFDIYVLYH
jgi:hypothetical protein